MGDVIAWSKLNKITKMVKNLPTSLATNFGEVKDSISGLVSNFNTWKADWTSGRAKKIDAINNSSENIKKTANTINNTMAKASDLTIVNQNIKESAHSRFKALYNWQDNVYIKSERVIGNNKTLAKLTGKGKIKYIMLFSNIAGQNTVIDIFIDSVRYKRLTLSATSDNRIDIFDITEFFNVGSSGDDVDNYRIFYKIEDDVRHIAIGSEPVSLRYLKPIPVSSAFTNSGYGQDVYNDSIEFNNSFEIKCISQPSNSYVNMSLVYAMD